VSPLSLRRYRAERLLRRDFDGLRATVLGGVRKRLVARGVAAEALDLDACYAQAWHGLYATVLAGDEVHSPAGWLVVVTFRRAIEDARSAALARRVELHDADASAPEPDLAERLDDMARLRHVFEGLRGRLSGRECQAASLCYLQGLSRSEAAARMGISERRMRKLMEGGSDRPGVAAKVGDLLAVVGRGRWCEEQASLMRGLAFGLLDPEGERHGLAVAHQRQCPACRAYVASLRGMAVALPPVAIPAGLGATAAAGAAGTAGAAGAAGAVGAGAGGGGWLLGGGALGAKLAAGCLLALGVGAGCVALTTPGPARLPSRAATRRPPARRSSPAARGTAVALARRTMVTPGTPVTGPSAARPASVAAPTAEPAARREFGPESTGASGAGAAARGSSGGPASTPLSAAPARLARTVASTPASSRPEPSARREFGLG
jgi:DNA-directed RNA polymerase specialized sigma24 family protein